MHSNSITVYEDSIKPTLSNRQQKVINVLEKLKQATCLEVAKYLKVPHHTISGRFTDLKKKALITEIGTKHVNSRPHSIYTLLSHEQ